MLARISENQETNTKCLEELYSTVLNKEKC